MPSNDAPYRREERGHLVGVIGSSAAAIRARKIEDGLARIQAITLLEKDRILTAFQRLVERKPLMNPLDVMACMEGQAQAFGAEWVLALDSEA